MKVKFIANNKTLFNEDLNLNLNEEETQKLNQFNDREIISYLVEFNEGLKVEHAHDINDISPEFLKQITIKIK